MAFVLLVVSRSYVFATFFKIFLLIVVFGLFHGLIFLPVILSLVGGTKSSKADPSQNNVSTSADEESSIESLPAKKDSEKNSDP